MTLSRRKVAQYIADRLANGQSVHDSAQTIAAYLIETKSLRSSHVLVKEIEKALSDTCGHSYIKITSAKELDRAVSKELEKIFGKGATTEVSVDTNEALIGGVMIEVTGKEFDASIASKLKKLKAV